MRIARPRPVLAAISRPPHLQLAKKYRGGRVRIDHEVVIVVALAQVLHGRWEVASRPVYAFVGREIDACEPTRRVPERSVETLRVVLAHPDRDSTQAVTSGKVAGPARDFREGASCPLVNSVAPDRDEQDVVHLIERDVAHVGAGQVT